MKLAIMQPYFLPYVGYFQLLANVDKFVIYDNIQFTKRGWIHRNRILQNGRDAYVSLPLKKDADFLNINQRFLSDDFDKEKLKLLRRIQANYVKAPYFREVYPLIEAIFNHETTNLFAYILFSVISLADAFDIQTEIIKSSELDLDIELYKGEDKVLKICETLNATTYINAIGGKELYSKQNFLDKGIKLEFIRSNDIVYNQYNKEFVPWLSIIDVMMFNSKETINHFIRNECSFE